MDGPLDPSIYRTDRPVGSWWEASAPPERDRPPLDREIVTDVAIIGGGYAGLSCARALAEHGIGAAVLDAAGIGWGASGRAGGIVGHGGAKLSDATLRRRFGDAETARAHDLQTRNIRDLRAFCLEAGLADAVQGDGELILAHSARIAGDLAREPATERVLPSGLPDVARFGGAKLRPAFGIHPLRLVRAIARAAEDAGAEVFPRSEVTRWERAGNGHRLVTPGGAVRASRVVMAANGFTPDRLHPSFRGRAVPVISNIGVTRPLTPGERARHPWIGEDPAADTRHLLVYFRLLPEGRLLFGMRGDIRGSERGADRMRARLERRLAQAFPGFAGAELTHFWRGPVCATASLRPAIGGLADDPTVFHAFGWHGSGICMGTLAGRLLGGVIAGAPETTIPAPWRGLPPALPLPGLRPLYVGAAMAGYALLDGRG